MAIRTSYSQTSTYIKCPQHWHWKYQEKLDGEKEGASLHFGTAMDLAVMSMLEGKDDYIVKFNDRWYSFTDKHKEYFQIFDNPLIMFAYSDFDEHVLTKDDLEQIKFWITDLGLSYDPEEPIEAIKKVISRKKSNYTRITVPELRLFNRACWASMRRKGEILLKLFKEQFLPKVKKVIATQKFYHLKDEVTGDMLMGALDFVAEVEGYDKPIILDLKTAGRPYTEENIKLSEQLPIYLALSKGQFKTDLVGYVVLVKNIQKKKSAICSVCSFKKKGMHRTCNNTIDGKRCGGKWKETVELDPQMQVIIEKKSEKEVNKVLISYGEVVEAMKQNIVYKNVQQCYSWFGSKCVYFDACHNDKFDGLKKRARKK